MALAEVKSKRTVVRFGPFELDTAVSELRKHGVRIRVQIQPMRILQVLLERPGEIVTREALRQVLWPADTFVDFDRGLNKAVNKLRAALNDDADTPRYIETVARRGYRFIAPTTVIAVPDPPGPVLVPAKAPAPESGAQRAWRLWFSVAAILAIGTAILLDVGGWRERVWGGPAQVRSIAVLPFIDLSGDPEQEYFAEGMTEMLINDLSKIGVLRVISRTSAMQYRATGKSLPEVARELKVDAVVEGSVLRAGNRVRINVRLTRALDDQPLWADSYERDISNVLDMENDVASQIADTIRVRLTPEERIDLARRHPVNPAAQEAYLKGRFFWNSRSAEGLTKGLQYFTQAVQDDPNDAAAYTGIADYYIVLHHYGVIPFEKAEAPARAAVQRALELDDKLAEAHTSAGAIHMNMDRDFAGAEREFKRALELNPGYVTAHMWYAELLARENRFAEARAEIDRAKALDPLSAIVFDTSGWIRYLEHDYAGSLAESRQALELDPTSSVAHWTSAVALEQLGRYQEALAEYTKCGETAGMSTGYIAGLGNTYARMGDRRRALDELERLRLASRKQYVMPFNFAAIYLGLGDRDDAIAYLKTAVKERSIETAHLKLDPVFDPIRSDPRYAQMVRDVETPIAPIASAK